MQQISETDAQAWSQKDLAGWSKTTQKLAAQLIVKYGKPGDVTSRQLVWYDNGPWRRTVLAKEGAQHNFPVPHKNVLEQTVNYKVPARKLGEVMEYAGGAIVDRVRGEVTARSDSEVGNIIILNLVNDIVTDNRNLLQANVYHAQLIRGIQTGDIDPYTNALRFQPQANTAEPGEVAPLLKHLQSETPEE
jgi:hypothetical protein